MDLIYAFGEHWDVLLGLLGPHALVSAISVLIAVALAVPLGATLGHLHRFSNLAINGANLLRALPTLALVAIFIGVFGLGLTNIIIALVILSFPLILTNTYVAVAGVQPGIVEAARGMGMDGWQILSRVELPNAVPLIMTGIRTSWVYTVATAYLGAVAGATGFTYGDIFYDVAQYRVSGVIAGAIMAILLAFAGDRLLALLERALIPTGLTVARVPAAA